MQEATEPRDFSAFPDMHLDYALDELNEFLAAHSEDDPERLLIAAELEAARDEWSRRHGSTDVPIRRPASRPGPDA